ncbi:MAG: ABC transporter permease [Solirubrobacterales bacterium]|nr:ABC transporter permease [Solirubrobacterales bacterium]
MSTGAAARLRTSERGLQEIRGPSALAGDFRRFVVLTRTIALMDFKLRFFGSALGYLWQLMRPLMLFGVLYVMFAQILPVGGDLPSFGIALLLGIVLFTFFSEATSGAVPCVVERENLVRKIQFPRMVIPMAVVLTACFNLALNLVVVLIFATAARVTPHWGWLALVPLVGLLVIFASGVAMLLSALYVRYRDIQPIWDVVLQAMFYGSLILVPYETVVAKGYDTLASVLLCNPLAAVVQQARNLAIDPAYVDIAAAIGGGARVLIPAAVLIGTFLLGLWVFNREAPRIAEEL